MLHSNDSTRFAQTIRHRRPIEPTARLAGSSETETASRISTAIDRPWLHGRVPNGYWDYRENRVNYLHWLGKQYGFQSPADWYSARKCHFQKSGGGGLLRNQYQSSVLKAMHDFLPEFDWKPWMFGGAPRGFWKNRENRSHYLNWLADRLQIKSTDEWYTVTGADFFQHHGGGLLNNEFRGSVQAVLADFKPWYPWKAWRFVSVPQCFWNSVENRRAYLRWLGDQLQFRDRNDWQSLRREDFYANSGSGVFVGYYRGSTEKAIAELFADDNPSTLKPAAADPAAMSEAEESLDLETVDEFSEPQCCEVA